MASTTALYTGLSGLTVHSRRLEVVGNNISNVNTTAYKGSRLQFESKFTTDFKLGAPPTASLGGTNPGQIGLGVGLSGTQRDMRPGSVTITGDPRDLAIDGPGFFIVERGGSSFYTRNGAFQQDENDNLVTIGGEKLQGYGVDANFNLQTGQLTDISVPIGKLRVAVATTEMTVGGNLNAGGDVASTSGLTTLLGTPTSGLSVISSATPASLAAGTLLTDIEDPDLPGSDIPLFSAGQSLQFTGIEKGGRAIPPFSVNITATTTVQDLIDEVNLNFGLFSSVSNPDGTTPGLSLNTTDGSIEIVSNAGSDNDLSIESANIRLLNSAGALVRLPFVANQVQTADGESRRTTAIAYDSLGNTVEIDVTFTLVEKNASGTTWRYDVSSRDDLSGNGPFLTTGTAQFDTLGELVGPNSFNVSIDRAAAGADSPLTFAINLSGPAGRMTSLAGAPSEFASVARDGLPAGTLERFGVDAEGIVVGSFSNGAARVLGQVVIANFTNPEGLIDLGSGLFNVGANSGPAAIVTPGQLGTGSITGGALEQSNVDLGQEFINLILTSTGYNASSRVIRTTDELIQQLLVLGR